MRTLESVAHKIIHYDVIRIAVLLLYLYFNVINCDT